MAPFREIREGYECLPTADALDPTKTSEARAGCAEVRGRPARKQEKTQNRTEWVLGKVAPGKRDRKWKLTEENSKEKQGRSHPADRVKGLRHYFEAKGKDLGPPLEKRRLEDKNPGPEMDQDPEEATERTDGKNQLDRS